MKEAYKARFTHSREWQDEARGEVGSLVIPLAARLAIRLGSKIHSRVPVIARRERQTQCLHIRWALRIY